jgi:hypothetical protein
MYLFSLWNFFDNNTLIFVKDVKVYTLEMLWGQTNETNETNDTEENYEFVIELKNNSRLKKYIKYTEFLKKVDPNIEPLLQNFLMTVQNQCYVEAVYESDEINSKIICFRIFTYHEAKEIGNPSRQGIESERSIVQFLFGSPANIFMENINVWNSTLQKNNETPSKFFVLISENSSGKNPFNDTTNWKEDKCSKTLNGCSLRFSDLGTLPFGSFPGTVSYEYRLPG